MPVQILTFKAILNLLMIILIVAGGLAVTIISQAKTCVVDKENCNSILNTLGSALLSPQYRISNAVDRLKNTEELSKVPEEYKGDIINTLQSEIIIGSLISLGWIYFTFKLVKIFIGPININMLIVSFLFAFLFLGFLQSLAGWYFEGEFVIPWIGFMKLAFNTNILSKTYENAIQAAKDIANPLV